MSDIVDSMSEAFSASEDEWKPNKDMKDGESSDDDDSDFDEVHLAGGGNVGNQRCKPKVGNAAKQSTKKRTSLSLRSKLFNKYRPLPKILSPKGTSGTKYSQTPSTSRANSKKVMARSFSKKRFKTNEGESSGSSSESSIDNYLVNPKDLDIQSSFFNVEGITTKTSSTAVLDYNTVNKNLSESASDNDKDGTIKDKNAFDFNNLLEYAKSMENIKKNVAKHNAEACIKKTSVESNIDNMDVYAVLALGEKRQNRFHNDAEDEYDKDDEGLSSEQHSKVHSTKLNKTKSTRIKRHTKTRPTSTVAANDTDDSDWEEVEDPSECYDLATSRNSPKIGDLEIHVELPSRKRENKKKSEQDIENALKRRLNRDIKERQVLLHKASLLCQFARLFYYNRLLNDALLMKNVLKLLPSKSAYPSDRGTEVKYFQSMVTWFKTVIKLQTQNVYPEKSTVTIKSKIKLELLQQIEKKEARSKQDMIFIFIVLLRSMGLQCRLVVNMQPLPLKPLQTDLLKVIMKKDGVGENKINSVSVKGNNIVANIKDDSNLEDHSSKAKEAKQADTDKYLIIKAKNKCENHDNTSRKMEKISIDSTRSPYNRKSKTCNIDSNRKETHNKFIDDTKFDPSYEITNSSVSNKETKKEASIKILKQTENICQKRNRRTKDAEIKSTAIANFPSSNTIKEKNFKGKHISEEYSIPKRHNANNVDTAVKNSSLLGKKHAKVAQFEDLDGKTINSGDLVDNLHKENKSADLCKNDYCLLNQIDLKEKGERQKESSNNKQAIESCSIVMPKKLTISKRSRNKTAQAHISTDFLLKNTHYEDKCSGNIEENANEQNKAVRNKRANNKVKISTDFLQSTQAGNEKKLVLRSRKKTNEVPTVNSTNINIYQLDGANDHDFELSKTKKSKRPNLNKINGERSAENSDYEPSPSKKPKTAPGFSKQNRRVLSSDDESGSMETKKHRETGINIWIEVWCDVEEQWVCVDIFKAKILCVDTITKSASHSLAYVFAFQNDLSIKDVTARYCLNWATIIRKSRVDKDWLDKAIQKYLGLRTKRDIKEDHELRRIHEEKPMPTAISDYKNHPFYALERHLLKFEAIYPPEAPALGYIRGQAVFSRDCVHTLHSREIWLKQARTVKLGEQPYKIVKARPKWDRINQTVIKDQPLEIFGYWQTQDYVPPTAENGLVPRNAYGNVELFKPSMLPKKTKHIRLPGLNRICKKLNIDCANAVVGFDFHQGACHPTYDGFVVCEEFEDQVVSAWHQAQEEQERKEQDKYEARVYGNWKKLIRGLLIRERLKLKYNF